MPAPFMRFRDRMRLEEWASVFNFQEGALTDEQIRYLNEWEEDPDDAYTRHLENQGWAAAEFDRMMEDRAGVVQFEDEMDRVNAEAEAEYWVLPYGERRWLETHPLR
jgi:hypothetical protein